MERVTLISPVFAFFLAFAVGCAVEPEKPGDKPAEQISEEKALEFLKSKGARFHRMEAKTVLQPIEPFWSAILNDVRISDAHLHRLKQIKSLKHVSIGANVTDEGIATLAELDQLELLIISSHLVSVRGIDKLADIRTLESLTLIAAYGMRITDQGFERFARLEKLRVLKLEKQPISDKTLACIKGLKTLEELYLSGTRVSDDGLKFLKTLGRLARLDLAKTSVTDVGMAELIDLPQLNNLDLSGTAVGNDGLKLLSRSKSLAGLRLDSTRIDDDGLAHLVLFENLTHVGFMNTRVSDVGLEHLRKTKLTALELHNDRFTDKGLDHLREMKTLKRVSIQSSKITEAGIQQLKKALPNASIGRLTK
jgi:Leucine-rich repeat (LRR) protein